MLQGIGKGSMTVTDPRQIVAAKRDGHTLAAEEIEAFVRDA